MLRHYEKCGLFYPAEIDRINGYRLYSATQIPLILRIITLRDMGFSIEEISDILDNFEENAYIEKAISRKASEIQASIDEENRKMERLQVSLKRIENGNYTTTCRNVILKQIPKIKVLSIREIVPDYSYQEQLWGKLYSFIEKNSLYPLLGENVIAIYHETEYKESNVDIEVAVTVKELLVSNGSFIFKELEAISCAATVVCDGSYEKILPEGEAVLGKWIEDNGYEIKGSERGFGIRHPANEQDPNNYQTEIQFPVEKQSLYIDNK
jgi:DNA-binding transcriptional MerR regulator/predicted transcriptional regulator YdeE